MSTEHGAELSLQLPTPRELVRPVFRYRSAVAATFAAVVAVTLAYVALQPRIYIAEMKILVKRERLDPIMTSDARAPAPAPSDITETELYSEVELLKSRDLLERVVLETGLHQRDASSGQTPTASTPPSAGVVARAARVLRANLDVQPIKRTTLIRVAYSAQDAQLAARVLDRLASLYLEKHLAVHRPAGAHQFFKEQATRLQQELRTAQEQLRAFTEREHVVSASDEKAITLRLLSEFEAGLEQTEASLADVTRRRDAINS
jgi:polysaccharide biosynthesis transport protein